jgi:hypothetical protein
VGFLTLHMQIGRYSGWDGSFDIVHLLCDDGSGHDSGGVYRRRYCDLLGRSLIAGAFTDIMGLIKARDWETREMG